MKRKRIKGRIMGTPGVKFDRPKSEIVEAIIKNNGKLTKVAKQLRCCYETVRKYTDDDPEIVQLIHNLRQEYDENLCDLAEDTLTDAMDARVGDMANALKSAFFVLNNKGRNRGYNPPQAGFNTGVQATPEQILKMSNGN